MNGLLDRLSEVDAGLLITVDEVDVSLDEMSHLVSTYQHFGTRESQGRSCHGGASLSYKLASERKEHVVLRRAQQFELGPLAPYAVEEAFRLTVGRGR